MQEDLVVSAIKKVLPSVVTIIMSKYLPIFERISFSPFDEGTLRLKGRKKVRIGAGSGFFVKENGIILTNRHVIGDPQAEYVVILQSGEKFKPEILAKDEIHDIAILKIEKEKVQPVSLGDSEKVELGQTVIAIGNALGLFQNTVSVGVVSGISRVITAQDTILEKTSKLRGLIQTDAAVNPGNSGGPLINLRGEAIGINAAIVFGAENISFAIPINSAKKDIADLEKFGRIRQPFLGVRYLGLNEELKEKFNLPFERGALIIAEPDPYLGEEPAVINGSPAKKAGLKEGDIILEIAGKKITPSLSLTDILSELEVGQEVSLIFWRNGKIKKIKLELGERK